MGVPHPVGVVRLLRFVYHLRRLVNGLRRILTVLPALLHLLVHRHHLFARLRFLARFGGLLSHHEHGERRRQCEAHDGRHLDLFQFHSYYLSGMYGSIVSEEAAGREAFEEVIRDSKIW